MLSFLLVAFFSQCTYIKEIQKQREKVYNDLKALCESLPTPEGLRKIGSQDLVKPDRGSFTMNFQTDLDCKSAGLPYYSYLASNGWKPTAPNSRYYYKENYIIDVSCDHGPKNIQISCGWSAAGEKKDVFKEP